jgi:Fe-S-cluster-containing hydrogenase component 2
MTTAPKGLGLVTVCDYCGYACGFEVITLLWQNPPDNERVLKFCSMEHLGQFLGVDDRVASETDKRFKSECNLLYKEVCPACKRRIQKKFL